MNTQYDDDFDDDDDDFERPIIETTHDIKRLNDEMGLTAIAKFGWLRAREIGNVLWPNNPSRNVAGARIIRRWKKEKLVIERKLPDGFGSAFVLSKRGAEFVDMETKYGDENDVISGKKIGDHIEQIEGVWIPTRSWRHDLLANGFLTLAMGHGAEVFSELELRREDPHARKFPDGLYRTDSDAAQGLGFWAIEVERSGKFSTNARALAAEIVEARLRGYEIAGKFVEQTVIVFEDPQKQHYGSSDRKIADHFERVASQVKGLVPLYSTVDLIGIPLLTKGGGVVGISPVRHLKIDWSEKAVIDKSVFGHDWSDLNEHKRCYLHLHLDILSCPFEVWVTKTGNRDFEIAIDRRFDDARWGECQERLLFEKVGNTDLVNVQKRAVLALQKCQKYREWASENIHKLSSQ
jgi:phenylpyruvate tautomerase PptA (4-oxalocrotonate tautomerase family)